MGEDDKKATKKTTNAKGFSAEEKAAMRQRAASRRRSK